MNLRRSLRLVAPFALALACRRSTPAPAPVATPAPARVTAPAAAAPNTAAPAAAPGEAPGTPTVQGESSVRTRAPSAATGCPATAPVAALGPGTVHGSIVNMNEVWTLADSPHRLPEGLEIHAGATLTLAPCAVVLLGHGQGLNVGEGGALNATGAAMQPVRFGSDNPQPQPGDWLGVFFNAQARRTSSLANVVISTPAATGTATPRACS